ncbi:uncharacterized protein LOC144134894 isoform X2 [Amblyomma americanum]
MAAANLESGPWKKCFQGTVSTYAKAIANIIPAETLATNFVHWSRCYSATCFIHFCVQKTSSDVSRKAISVSSSAAERRCCKNILQEHMGATGKEWDIR